MNIASTIQQVRETKEDAMARVNAVNNTATNGTNNTANSNAAVAQPKTVVKPDIVELSPKSVELATKVEEMTKKVTAAEKSTDTKTNYRQAMKQSQRELRGLVKGLKKAGMGRREVSKIIRTANRAANKTISTEIRQAYNDYRSHKTDRQSFKNTLYGSAVKKLDGIVSALKDALAQKVAPEDKNTEAVKEKANTTVAHEATDKPRVNSADEASKANADKGTAATKEKAEEVKPDELFGASKARVTNANEAAKENAGKSEEATKEAASKTSEKTEKTETTPAGLVVKAEKEAAKVAEDTAKDAVKAIKDAAKDNGNSGLALGAINANENADKAFGQIIDFFNGIDKMINGFADKAEGKGNDDEDGDSLINFASRLNDMFSSINKAFGRHSDDNVGLRLGMAQVKKETASQLFDNGHGSGAINRIGDAGEGSGSFNAVSFMSSISNGINDALESYKEVQRAEKEAAEEAAEESDKAAGTSA